MKDLLYFLAIILVVLLGVGVYYHSIMFPSHVQIFGPAEMATWSFWKVIYYPYFQMYGETFDNYLHGLFLEFVMFKFKKF